MLGRCAAVLGCNARRDDNNGELGNNKLNYEYEERAGAYQRLLPGV